ADHRLAVVREAVDVFREERRHFGWIPDDEEPRIFREFNIAVRDDEPASLCHCLLDEAVAVHLVSAQRDEYGCRPRLAGIRRTIRDGVGQRSICGFYLPLGHHCPRITVSFSY